MPPSLKIGIVLVTCVIIYIAGVALGTNRTGEKKAARLVNGDTSVEIERFHVEYQQRRVSCNDPELLAEFTEGFRHAVPKPKLGTTYFLTIHFQHGGTCQTPLYVRDGELSVCIPPNGEGAPTHLLVFPNARGAKLARFISFLDQPWQSVANTELVFRDGEPPKLEKAKQ